MIALPLAMRFALIHVALCRTGRTAYSALVTWPEPALSSSIPQRPGAIREAGTVLPPWALQRASARRRYGTRTGPGSNLGRSDRVLYQGPIPGTEAGHSPFPGAHRKAFGPGPLRKGSAFFSLATRRDG